MSISMRQLQRDLDKYWHVSHPNNTITLDQLGRLHRWGGESYQSGELQRPNILSLRDLGHRHSNVFKFLWLNTYLLPTIKIHVPVLYDGEITGAPDLHDRAVQIGAMIGRENYNAAALCEVFTEESKYLLLTSCNNPAWARGPDGGTWTIYAVTVDIASSGLLTVIPGPYSLIGYNREKFNNEGDKKRDADAWSNKGIVLAVVDTGFNTKFELYSTHLIYGGDFHDISPQDRMDVQREQIDQLVSFIQRTHNPTNFILVAGDFNLDAGSGYYEELRGRMEDRLELEDVWTRYAQSRYGSRLGKTDNPAACEWEHGRDFADDGIGGAVDDSGRIDYIFVQKPCDSHDITIDVSRPRRRLFHPDPSLPGYDHIQYLSDHIGLELSLFFASK